MLASSRMPQRRRRPRSAAVAAGAVLLLSAVAGCSDDPAPEPPAAVPTAEATPLADYDTSDLTLARGEFCERIADEAVLSALDADPTDQRGWQPGERLPGTKDISNEFGCSWSTPSVTARAWVFAPPITRARASDFADEVVGAKCEELQGAPSVGSPGVAQRCELNSGATLTGYYGLVGDAWIGCEVSRGPSSSTSSAEPAESARVGEWCVAVLEALRSA